MLAPPSLGGARRRAGRHGELGEVLVDGDATSGHLLRHLHQAAEALGVAPLAHPATGLVTHVLARRELRRPAVEQERRLALGNAPRVPAVERPDARVDRLLLLLGAE